jgi:dTMP kinase
MNKARYLCVEGLEGVGKTTQVKLLVEYLKSKGYSVLNTKEPGTPLNSLTMVLRGIMLDSQYENDITPVARELVSQAIRSIHMDRVIYPAMDKYDFIVQDRGILSGLSYGAACGHDVEDLEALVCLAVNMDFSDLYHLYDNVIYMVGDVTTHLNRARSAKQEFAAGDAMEAKGIAFLNSVSEHMDKYSEWFKTNRILVDGRSIEEIHADILRVLKL